MAASEDRIRLGKVRIRLGDRRVLVVPTYSSDATAPAAPSPPILRSAPPAPPTPQRMPAVALPQLAHRVLVALIEAVPSRAELLAATMITAMEAAGSPCAAVSLEPQNRLGVRFGCAVQSDPHGWRLGPAATGVQQGHRTIIPAPSSEEALESGALTQALSQITDRADLTIVDLGCRWVPRLFRPVLTQATHIWLVARAGQWTGVEMRLEQAEFSGWTPMHRIRLVVVGEEPGVPPQLSPIVAGVLRDPEAPAVAGLMEREFRRGTT